MSVLICSSEGCTEPAAETLFLRDQVGHVHDCTQDAAVLREWCDVVYSAPIVEGECLAVACTGNGWVMISEPTRLSTEDEE